MAVASVSANPLPAAAGSSHALLLVPCPLCGGSRVRESLVDRGWSGDSGANAFACTSLEHGRFGRIVQCRSCTLSFRSPREDDETLARLYAEVEDVVYAEQEAGRVATFERALDRLELRVPARGSLLDVGCYTGVFLDVAARRGWRTSGIEPSRWAAARARARGHRLLGTSLSAATVPAASQSVVTLWDVIEHLPDPLRELRRARAALEPGGHLAVSTIRRDALAARVLGRRWPWYMRMHLVYFTKRTLRRAIEQAGFEILSIERYAHIVTVGYLARKLGALFPAVAPWIARRVQRAGLAGRRISVDLGDCIVAYARRGGGP
jgi:SAM-dependent methyltransferase